MHLANYNQPNVQMYIVRILWMVPIYSMESWLCLRFHRYAIYIEALRDVYESYVLYSFLQFLIQVLGGEEELILMLKDKSPTRGVHMWGLQWCLKPWLMGQPVSSTATVTSTMTATKTTMTLPRRTQKSNNQRSVQWTSPFYVKCKFGVLQYVLLKFVSSIFVMTLELNDMYKEGDFRLTSGYLYICVVTNFSQCWALYCLIFFYHATKNELSPIRPVAKFISVKALVFFTWWQSLFISIIYQMNLIPHYHASNESEWTSEDVAKGLQDYLICIEMFIGAIVHVFVFPHTDYLPEAVQARQQSLHPTRNHPKRQLGRRHPLSAVVSIINNNNNDCSSVTSKNSELDVPLSNTTVVKSHYPQLVSAVAVSSCNTWQNDNGHEDKDEENCAPSLPSSSLDVTITSTTTTSTTVVANSKNTMSGLQDIKKRDASGSDDTNNYYDDPSDSSIPNSEEVLPLVSQPPRTGFVKALIDSTIPRDILDQSVGIVKGDYVVEKKSLLSHAATSDAYELFSSSRRQHYWNSNHNNSITTTTTATPTTATTTTTAKKNNKDG
jgi:Organic solute transporter Ostalpha